VRVRVRVRVCVCVCACASVHAESTHSTRSQRRGHEHTKQSAAACAEHRPHSAGPGRAGAPECAERGLLHVWQSAVAPVAPGSGEKRPSSRAGDRSSSTSAFESRSCRDNALPHYRSARAAARPSPPHAHTHAEHQGERSLQGTGHRGGRGRAPRRSGGRTSSRRAPAMSSRNRASPPTSGR
jgi:hypothetical protein